MRFFVFVFFVSILLVVYAVVGKGEIGSEGVNLDAAGGQLKVLYRSYIHNVR